MTDSNPDLRKKASFAEKRHIHSLKLYKKVLDHYRKGIESALKLKGKGPIFLDTNVLLSVYEVSYKARAKIKQFIKSHKERIILSSQVQFEFIKNREKIIDNFQTSVTEQIPRSFQFDIANKLKAFKESNKKKLEDYPEIQEQLDDLYKSVNNLQEVISDKVSDKNGMAHSLFQEDDFLDLLCEISTLATLDGEHMKSIRNDYDILLKDFRGTGKGGNQEDSDGNLKDTYSLKVFPGCGEKGDKDDPTGDYIIFHEMMEYASENKADVIFLTNDVVKGDWIRKEGTAHTHYLENFYENTGQMIYILNAERVFETLFTDTSFESLVPQNKINIALDDLDLMLSNINNESVMKFLEQYPPFETAKKAPRLPNYLCEELELNGFHSIGQLKEVLDQLKHVTGILMKQYKQYSKVQLLRSILRVHNRDYNILENDGSIKPLNRSRFDHIINLLDIL